MAWYKSLLGKVVTVNGCGGAFYQGRFVACLNGRLFLQDVFVCQEDRKSRIPLLALDKRHVRCLYLKEEGQTITLESSNFD